MILSGFGYWEEYIVAGVTALLTNSVIYLWLF